MFWHTNNDEARGKERGERDQDEIEEGRGVVIEVVVVPGEVEAALVGEVDDLGEGVALDGEADEAAPDFAAVVGGDDVALGIVFHHDMDGPAAVPRLLLRHYEFFAVLAPQYHHPLLSAPNLDRHGSSALRCW